MHEVGIQTADIAVPVYSEQDDVSAWWKMKICDKRILGKSLTCRCSDATATGTCKKFRVQR